MDIIPSPDRPKLDRQRSIQEIRGDIAREKEDITQTVGEISKRLKGKMDWRLYLDQYPYLTVGAVMGLGFLASQLLIKRRSPFEEIVETLTGTICSWGNGRRRAPASRFLLAALPLIKSTTAGLVRDKIWKPSSSGNPLP